MIKIIKMTKLMEWVMVLIVLLSVYLSLITGQIKSKLFDPWMFQIQIFPIIAIGMFGVSAIHWHSNQFLVNKIFKVSFHCIFAALFSFHHFIPSFYIEWLSRSCRRDSKTNRRSKSWIEDQRTEILIIYSNVVEFDW